MKKNNTTTLFRPIGMGELNLIQALDMGGFPPRLDWQPIFYPVLNQEYAAEIASRWNTKDQFSGYCGFVTAFEVDTTYLVQFEIQNVGSAFHNEYWIPSEELDNFNANIVGKIQLVKAFYGEKYVGSKIPLNNKV